MKLMFHNIRIIAQRELNAYFTSPLAYIFIIIFLLLVGVSTFILGDFFKIGEASLRGTLFAWLPWLYLFLVPAIGMRIWSNEHHFGTIELLLTYPIKIWHALVGKFMAAWIVLIIANLLTFPVVATLIYLGKPDLGAIICGYLGSILLSGAYLAIAGIASATTRNQVIAFTIGTMLCFTLQLLGFSPVTEATVKMFPDSKWIVDSLSSLSASIRFEEFQKGYMTISGVVYFISVIIFCLYLTSVILEKRKK